MSLISRCSFFMRSALIPRIGLLHGAGGQSARTPTRPLCAATDDVTVHYINKKGERITVVGKVGEDIMRLAQKHSIEIEGACEASVACSTCHVYVHDDYFDKLKEAEEREEDMLDMAPFLKANSRLGCQIALTKEMDGIEVKLPPATRNFYVDGKVPAPH